MPEDLLQDLHKAIRRHVAMITGVLLERISNGDQVNRVNVHSNEAWFVRSQSSDISFHLLRAPRYHLILVNQS